MKFDVTNDATYYRQNAWYSDETWPVSTASNNESGFRDYLTYDYLPNAEMFENRLEHALSHNNMFMFFRRKAYVVWGATSLYLLFVFLGPRFMRNRPAFNLKGTLAVWNLLLTVFSVCGVFRLGMHVLYGLWINPPGYFLCRNGTRHSREDAVYAWIALFMFSKFAEFADTAFLILRKKRVDFLHWFHHASVAIYTWYSLSYQSSTGTVFAAMNYSVHCIMYFYYFLAAIGKPPKWGLAVTIIQIAQMFVGIFLNIAQFYSAYKYPHCDVSWPTFWAATGMYAIYLGLFLQFFIKRYCQRSPRRPIKAD